MKRGRAVLLGAVGVVGALVLWELISRLGIVSELSLPPASTVLERLAKELGRSATWTATAITLMQAVVSIVLCTVIAVPLGILIGRVPAVDRYTRSTIDFLRAMPGIALVPLFLLFIGATSEMVIFLASFAAIWPLLIQVIEGARSVEELALNMARGYRLSRGRQFFRVVLPATMPSIVTGLRLATTVALLVSIGAGLLSGAPGVGQLIAVANVNADGLGVFAFSLWSGVLGIAVLTVLRVTEGRLLAWHYARVQMERAA
ncbi:ABC transporter permease [Leucobacter sp. wl10]|uniref:ABC transporter permease n=1 Tax=Leucobacter sp. wl10 TaxID=2304677 RepID=UPI0013C2F738|nr:ABC transporter permease [Leucobacter sp. wl10]